MSASPPNSLCRFGSVWPWVVAAVPALSLLMMLAPLRVPVPMYDSWAFVRQYLLWTKGRYSWHEFLEKHGDHPSAVGKVLYFAVLHWMHGNVGLLILLSWVFMLVAAACVCWLSRPVWAGNRTRGAVLMFCITFTIFSAAQAGSWLWDFTYQNLIAGMCLCLGVLVLSGHALSRWRVAVAALLSLLPIFSVASGFLVGFLLSVFIWRGLNSKPWKTRCLLTGLWLFGVAAMAAIALKAFGHAVFSEEGPSPSLHILFDRPLMRVQFVLMLLGQMLGKGTSFEPDLIGALAGAALLIVFGACLVVLFRRRHMQSSVSAALPWLVFCLFGLASATLMCIGRMGPGTESYEAFHHIYALADKVLAERFINTTLFFTFGVIMLAAVLVREAEASGTLPRWVRASIAPALAVFIFLQTLNWETGWQLMKQESTFMKQERAMLSFGNFLRLDPERLWNRQLKFHTVDLARQLDSVGRLNGVTFVPDASLRFFKRGEELSTTEAVFNPPVPLSPQHWKLTGTCGILSYNFLRIPDLVVITAETPGEEERIVEVRSPKLPETFRERESQRRKYPEHYFGWSADLEPACLLDPASFPKGTITLRTYALEYGSRMLYPIRGSYQINCQVRADSPSPR